jgi:hypothetical protein
VHEIDRGELRAPAAVLDVDIARDYGDEFVDVERFATGWCLVRNEGTAVAARFVDLADETTLSLAALLKQIRPSIVTPTLDLAAPSNESLTVVICTRDRPDGLKTALSSLASQSDPRFDVLVVDNSNDGQVARTLCEFDGLSIRCCHEPLPGLSRARNRALAEVHSRLIAWIDDDEVADPRWIEWLKRGFASKERPAVVAGVMLPAELETQSQANFERYGGFNKGRGMHPEVLRAGTPTVIDPLYPLPNFGAGGNMAFRTDALRAIGGFDNRLGAGTLTQGGEDTHALSLILEQGLTILHWPPAVTWHYHRRTEEALAKQLFGNSAGLTAYYMSLLSTSPLYILRILGFVPAGVRRIRAHRRTGAPGGPPAGFPQDLLQAGRRGLRQGAWLYVREAWRQRKSPSAVGQLR